MPKTMKGRRSQGQAANPLPKGTLGALPDWLRPTAVAVHKAADTPSAAVMRDAAILGGLMTCYIKEMGEQRKRAEDTYQQRTELLAQAAAEQDPDEAAGLRIDAAKCAAKAPDWDGVVANVTKLAEGRRKLFLAAHELNPTQLDAMDVRMQNASTKDAKGKPTEEKPDAAPMWGGKPSSEGITTIPVPENLKGMVQ